MDERWRRVKALFQAAAERPADERDAFLDAAPGMDDDVRREVRSLLRADATDSVFDRLPLAGAAALAAIPPRPVLAAGIQIGPYVIDRLIGSGSMGEVYRARDTRLNRDVALKILPADLAGNLDRLARFRREAQVLATLNHPNIAGIYGLEETGRSTALVLEFIDGPTLAERMAIGPLSLREALGLARQIADALAAAHDKGIVHRDLKPANIAVDRAGTVKVLDFGLAKMSAVNGSPTSPDLTATDVQGRTVLGTPTYMSPEQARGLPLDRRADLWSFGCLLFEMLTGRPPFARDSIAETLAAVLEHDVDYSALPADTPPSVRSLLRRCLEKDPAKRLDSAAVARLELDVAIKPEPGQMVATLVGRHRGGLAVVVVIVAVVVASALYVERRSSRLAGSSPSLADLQLLQLTSTGNSSSPGISPDGKYVAYAQVKDDTASIWIRQTATSSNVQIVPPQRFAIRPGITITPDGTFVDFVRFETYGTQNKSALWRVPFLGGTPKRLLDDVSSPVGWSPDGRRMAFVRGDFTGTALVLADADGTHERVLTTQRAPAPRLMTMLAFGNPLVAPAWSPDGRVIASAGFDDSNGRLSGQIIFTTVADATVRAVSSSLPVGITGIAWLDDASLMLSGQADVAAFNQLWRVTYPGGELSRLTNDLSSYGGVSLTADRTSLATARSDARTSVWVADGSSENGREAVPPSPDEAINYGTGVAWAGERLLYTTKALESPTVESAVPGRGSPEEVVSKAVWPAATPDGRTVVFVSTDAVTQGSLWASDPEGRRKVQIASGNVLFPVVTPDRSVLFNDFSISGGKFWLWAVSLEGGAPTLVADIEAAMPDVSPDGKSVAFVTSDSSHAQSIMVCDLPRCSSRRRLSAVGKPRWTPDGHAVAYNDRSNLWIQPLDGSPPRQLTLFTDGSRVWDFAWSRNGSHLAIARTRVTNDIVLIKGLRK